MAQWQNYCVLSEIPLFAAIPPPERERLSARLVERRYAAGQMILARGEPGSSLMVAVEGRVRIGLTSAEGREILLNIVGPGQVFGEMALLDGRPRSADATALGACVLLALDRRDLMDTLRRAPEAGLRFIELLCERMRRMTEQVEAIALQPVDARLARLLLDLAATPPAGARVERPRIEPGLSQADLGRLIGVSRQKVNLWLGLWIAEGLLAREGRTLVVLDRNALAEIAGEAAP